MSWVFREHEAHNRIGH